MKRCPECGKTYPDSEHYCATDGVALVSADTQSEVHATQRMEPAAAPAGLECPVCGGKALPGETICSFCGAHLDASQPAAMPRAAQAPPGVTSAGTRFNQSFDDEPGNLPQESSSSGLLAWIGYIVAALIAVLAGAWFAWHLSSGPKQVAVGPSPSASVSPSVTANEPVAALAAYTPVTVAGQSSTDPARNADAAAKIFSSNNSSLLNTYRNSLATDPSLHDGMLIELTVTPDGSVSGGAVKTSTAPNPALDGEVINTMMGWHFAPFAGSAVKVSYPVILARNAAERSTVDSARADKVARSGPGETPEYASSPAAGAAPSVAAVASPAAAPSPAVAAIEPIAPPAAPAPAPPHERIAPAPPRHRTVARPRPPKPTLLARVQERLRADRRLNRVKAYTSNGGVVTIYGSVFDDKNRRLAVRTVKSVAGVTDVIDTLQTDTGLWAEQQRRVMAQLQGAGLNKVTIQIIGHDAYLDGEVSTPLQRDRAVTIAEGAAPVRVRTNLIRVVPKGVFGF